MSVAVTNFDGSPREVDGLELDCAVAVAKPYDKPCVQIGTMADAPYPGQDIVLCICAPGQDTLIAMMSDEDAIGLAETLANLVVGRIAAKMPAGSTVQ